MLPAIQVVDLGFGDAGKGSMVDYFVRRHNADVVIRFNGGPQAGHNVVLPDGRHHTFSQFGSGLFVPGVRTLLSRFMLVEPYAMLNEASHLESLGVTDILQRTMIDERCLVITPPQQVANRLRERARGPAAHGTCGRGVGECVADSLDRPELSVRAGDWRKPSTLRVKLRTMLDYKREQLRPLLSLGHVDERRVFDDSSWIETAVDLSQEISRRALLASPEQFATTLRASACGVFEGAQGVLLDERFGFHPHTTWSKTTFDNADQLLDECGVDAQRVRVGFTRTYLTRHGAGPMPTALADLNGALPEPHNGDGGPQGAFRRGVLDLILLRYALDACGGVDELALTHVDCLPQLPARVCTGYDVRGERVDRLHVAGDAVADERLTDLLRSAEPRSTPAPTHDVSAFASYVSASLGTPVRTCSRGPTFQDKFQLIEDASPSRSSD